MIDSSDVLSKITVFSKYSRYLPEKMRRESWEELVTRNLQMHCDKFPYLSEEIEKNYKLVYDKKILPSMRSFQFAGRPIEVTPSRINNCCAMPVDHPAAFSEAMFLLLGGTGLGYSVQFADVRKLPPVRGPLDRPRRYLVGDSIEGWSDAVKVLVNAYFFGKSDPVFDFRDIRPKGARLITSGGKAPGPQPLKDCLHNIRKVLEEAKGKNLRPIQVHDMMCYIADSVLAGGIRRAALISLFSMDDEEMSSCKFGKWYELNPQRGRANNSAVVLRHRVKEQDFKNLWKKVELSGSGEPGFYFTNNVSWLTNPCCEIALRPFQFCNLSTINASTVTDQEDFNERARAAAFIGTLQASYTDFHYLRSIWKQNTEKDALIGVSMTGIASGNVLGLDMRQASEEVRKQNIETAAQIGINSAARLTCVKPEGTSSMVLGSSSGIHAWHGDYYLRRMRVGKKEAICSYLSKTIPEYLEDDEFNPEQRIVAIPIKAPKGAITRKESTFDLLERIKLVSTEWVKPGHNSGDNTNNVSATISIKDGEWDKVGDWMWKNRNFYNGLSVLPHDGGTYVQAPFEEISREEYEKLASRLQDIDLTEIVEDEDETDLTGEIACGGGSCEIV